MLSPTDLIAFAAEWGAPGIVGIGFGVAMMVLWRDKRSAPQPGPSAQDLVDKVMRAADTAADTKGIRDDIDDVKSQLGTMHAALIKILAILESKR